MKRPNVNQLVGYVAPPAKPGESTSIKNGVVLEVFEDKDATGKLFFSARIDLTPRNDDGTAKDPENEPLGHHTAIARYDKTKKRENSFHFLEESSSFAAPARSSRPQPSSAPTA